jgi:hypothetical protein
VTLTAIVKKRISLPYYIYLHKYSYITGNAAAYLHKLITRVKLLKRYLCHFRIVLKHLYQRKIIASSLYRRADGAALKKMVQLEQQIKSRKLTAEQIEKEIKKLNTILQKMDYDSKLPPDCTLFGKNRECGVRELVKLGKFADRGVRKFSIDRLFTKVTIVRTPSRITYLDVKKTLVYFVRQGVGFKKSIRKANPALRRLVLAQAYKKLLQDKQIREFVKARLRRLQRSKSKIVKAGLRNKRNRKHIVRMIIKRFQKKKLIAAIRDLLKQPAVRQLRKAQYKDSVKQIVRQGQLRKEIMSFTPDVLKKTNKKDLKRLLEARLRMMSNDSK